MKPSKFPALDFHNKDALPSSNTGGMLAYLAESSPLPAQHVARVVETVKTLYSATRPAPYQVNAFSRNEIRQHDLEASLSFDQLCEHLEWDCKKPQIVCSNFALPHADEDFGGNAFVSKVLHTGPVPYHFCAHQRELRSQHRPTRSDERQLWHSRDRLLQEGDMLVFNPLLLHAAMPYKSHPEALLILLQCEASIQTPKEQRSLIARHPRHAFDRGFDVGTDDASRHGLPIYPGSPTASREKIEADFFASFGWNLRFDPALDVNCEWGEFVCKMLYEGRVNKDALYWTAPKKA